jgi:hypothetical protein
MIKMLYSSGRWAPILVCDICKDRIKDAQKAAAVHRMGDVNDGNVVEVFHTHKERCQDIAEEKLSGKYRAGWSEMSTHLIYLSQNTGIGADDIRAQDELRDIIGKLP